MTHPDLHLLALHGLIDEAGFLKFRHNLYSFLMECKTGSGKGRLFRLHGLDRFLGTPCSLTEKEKLKVEACLQVFLSLDLYDELIVEKTYILLEDLISYFKLQGLEDVSRYFDEHPDLYIRYQNELGRYLTPAGGSFREIHRSRTVVDSIAAELSLFQNIRNFEDKAEGHIAKAREYCKQYRTECYSFHKSWTRG